MICITAAVYHLVPLPDGVQKVVCDRRLLCPQCDRPLSKHDYRPKELRLFDGADFYSQTYLLPRWRCRPCHKVHVLSPCDLFFLRRRVHVAVCEEIYENIQESPAAWLEDTHVAAIRHAVATLRRQYAQKFGALSGAAFPSGGWLAQMLAAIFGSPCT